jgi:hypothetical protein
MTFDDIDDELSTCRCRQIKSTRRRPSLNTIRSSAEEIDLLAEMLLGVGKVKVNVEEVIDWIDCNKDYEDEVDNDSADDDEMLETHTQIRVKDESAIKSLNVVLKWTAENDVALTDIRRLQTSLFLVLLLYHAFSYYDTQNSIVIASVRTQSRKNKIYKLIRSNFGIFSIISCLINSTLWHTILF